MKVRIALWAGVGLLVASWWAVYAFIKAPITAEPLMWMLARLTCPIAFFSYYPMRLSWVLAANAATYALMGLVFESFLRRRPAH